MVQWLRLCASTAGDKSSIPGWGTKILHAATYGQKTKTTYYHDIRLHDIMDPGFLMHCLPRVEALGPMVQDGEANPH